MNGREGGEGGGERPRGSVFYSGNHARAGVNGLASIRSGRLVRGSSRSATTLDGLPGPPPAPRAERLLTSGLVTWPWTQDGGVTAPAAVTQPSHGKARPTRPAGRAPCGGSTPLSTSEAQANRP